MYDGGVPATVAKQAFGSLKVAPDRLACQIASPTSSTLLASEFYSLSVHIEAVVCKHDWPGERSDWVSIPDNKTSIEAGQAGAAR